MLNILRRWLGPAPIPPEVDAAVRLVFALPVTRTELVNRIYEICRKHPEAILHSKIQEWVKDNGEFILEWYNNRENKS